MNDDDINLEGCEFDEVEILEDLYIPCVRFYK